MQNFRLALTLDAHIHLGAFLASQMLEYEIPVGVLAGGAHCVYRHNLVPGQQAHLGRRPVGYHLDNHNAVVVGLERDPDAVEVAYQGLVHFLQILGRDIGRMGIQFLQHRDHPLFHYRGHVHLFHVGEADQLQQPGHLLVHHVGMVLGVFLYFWVRFRIGRTRCLRLQKRQRKETAQKKRAGQASLEFILLHHILFSNSVMPNKKPASLKHI